MFIGVTHTKREFQEYLDWIQRENDSVAPIILSYDRNNLDDLRKCDGLVLTGGGDVDPVLYDGDPKHPKLRSVDRKRDDFERKAIDIAVESRMAVLGICRGTQIANVHFGGTLVQDLHEHGYSIHETKTEHEQRHGVNLAGGSLVARLANSPAGNANSYHHQAVERIGNGLEVVARSEDGIPEALEFNGKRSESFFLLIQWHPERMQDFENPLSRNVLRQYLAAAENGKSIHNGKEP